MTNPATAADGLAGAHRSVRAFAARHAQVLRYFVIGVTASVIDVGLFLLLYNLAGFSDWAAHGISVPAGVVFSFTFNVRHNFRTTDHAALRFVAFCIVCVIGWGIGWWTIVGVEWVLGPVPMAANVGKVLSLPLVFLVQYQLNSRITFRRFGPT